MFDPDIPCRIMETRPCVVIAELSVVEAVEECALGDCARFERPLPEGMEH